MRTMKDFLKNNCRQNMPQWLAEYDGTIDIAAVQNTRCVYYPGAGFDGQPIHTFNGGNAAHLYIYADYGVEKQKIESELDSFKGYKVIGKHDIALNQLAPAWRPHIRMTKELVEESWQTDAPGVLGGMYSEPRQLFCRSCWR